MGNINASDNIMLQKPEKGKNMEIKEIFNKSHLKDRIDIEFTAC